MANMPPPPINFMSDTQHHLVEVLWSYTARFEGNVKTTTDDQYDALIYDVATALSEIWPNYKDVNVMLDEVCMYMRPTITSNNFNLIAWNVLKQIKSLMIKYQTSWRRNYAHDLRVIDQELGRLEAWHIRVDARVELITIRTRDLLTVLPEDVLAPIVQLAAEAETPL
jgi:hypothetical protein